MISVNSVPPETVDMVWPHVLPMIERGLRHGEGDSTTSDDLKADIKRGDKILWAVHDEGDILAVVILDVIQHPAKRTLFVVMIAGRDFHRWGDRVQSLLADLRELVGADTVEASVRRGLTKWLSDMGWKHKATLMELPYERRR